MYLFLFQDIISHNCKDLISTVPFLQNSSTQFITAVLTKLQFEVFLKGEYIVHAGAIGDKMYFIRTGIVEVLNNEDEVATTLSDGSHFGEICLLTNDRRVASVRAVTICDLFSLSKSNFQKLLDEFPEMRCTLETVALERLNMLGKEPKTEDIKKQGDRISTTIPPPHISKDASQNHNDMLLRYNHVDECACYHPLLDTEETSKDESTNVHPPTMECEDGNTDNQLSFTNFNILSEHSASTNDERTIADDKNSSMTL